MMPYIWLAVIVGALILEALTFTLVSIWFIPGALISLILALCAVPEWIQIVVFILSAIIFLIFCKPIAKNFLGVKRVATNADAVIGEKAVVTEDINNIEARGQVKVKGQVWSARSFDENVTFATGDVLTVIAIEGVKLICKK
ncbi:MAG: NfeD family protein [Clostridia bacterium]|nr:NfeD family protein [Clostridia bacterium]